MTSKNDLGQLHQALNGSGSTVYGSGVYRLDLDGQLVYANPAMLEMLGCQDLQDARSNFSARQLWMQPVEGACEMRSFESSWTRKDGMNVRARESRCAVRDGSGSLLYFEGVVENVSASRQHAVLDEDQRAVLDLVSGNATLDTILRSVVDMIERQITGSQVVIETVSGLHASSGRTASGAQQSFPITTGAGVHLGDILLAVPSGAAINASHVAILQIASRLAAVAIQSRRMAEDLNRQASQDRATDLPNRYAFAERLAQKLRRSGKKAAQVAVLWIGFDRFSGINETVGHKSGDYLLRSLGFRMKAFLLDSEWLARVGSDEFAVLCENAGRAAAEDCARRILQCLEAPFQVKNFECFLSARIGIALSPDDAVTPAALQQNAAAAHSRARAGGLTEFLFYERELGTTCRERFEIETDLRRALQQKELVLFYQPQVDLNQRLIGMEALIRWNHPTRGLLAPGHFMQVAEETGLIVQIGAWVIQQASRQCAEWRKTLNIDLKMAVNVSAMQFYFSDLPQIVSAALRETNLPPTCFELELTETAIMRNAEETSKSLEKLRAMGVTIAIDDFGTGYSSLSYLQNLPVDLLKIDRSFLQQIHLGATAAVVQAITTLAHSLGLRVAAEGIETQIQMDCIAGFGVDIAQGFLIGRPMAADKAVEWMNPFLDCGLNGARDSARAGSNEISQVADFAAEAFPSNSFERFV